MFMAALAVTTALAASSGMETLPVIRQGIWSYQSATSLVPRAVLLVQNYDDYCNRVEDFCNHLCYDERNELGCFMNCMSQNACPVGLLQNKAPEPRASSYAEMASRRR